MKQKVLSKKSQEIIFHSKEVRGDLYRYINKADVLVLLNRLPLLEYQHLKSVTFETCAGASAFGYVLHKRSKGVVICDQAPRQSVKTGLSKQNNLDEYGALNNMKWPTLAVRRFQLYNTFLHELRHTQVLGTGKKMTRDKMPGEKQANAYSDHWRGELYKDHFDHPDPVHNLPSKEEKERLQEFWPQAMQYLQAGAKLFGCKEYLKSYRTYEKAIAFMKLYHGDVATENHDVLKLEDRMLQIRGRLRNVTLSKKRDLELFESVREKILADFDAKEGIKVEEGSEERMQIIVIEGVLLRLDLDYLGVSLGTVSYKTEDFEKGFALLQRVIAIFS